MFSANIRWEALWFDMVIREALWPQAVPAPPGMAKGYRLGIPSPSLGGFVTKVVAVQPLLGILPARVSVTSTASWTSPVRPDALTHEVLIKN